MNQSKLKSFYFYLSIACECLTDRKCRAVACHLSSEFCAWLLHLLHFACGRMPYPVVAKFHMIPYQEVKLFFCSSDMRRLKTYLLIFYLYSDLSLLSKAHLYSYQAKLIILISKLKFTSSLPWLGLWTALAVWF